MLPEQRDNTVTPTSTSPLIVVGSSLISPEVLREKMEDARQSETEDYEGRNRTYTTLPDYFFGNDKHLNEFYKMDEIIQQGALLFSVSLGIDVYYLHRIFATGDPRNRFSKPRVYYSYRYSENPNIPKDTWHGQKPYITGTAFEYTPGNSNPAIETAPISLAVTPKLEQQSIMYYLDDIKDACQSEEATCYTRRPVVMTRSDINPRNIFDLLSFCMISPKKVNPERKPWKPIAKRRGKTI